MAREICSRTLSRHGIRRLKRLLTCRVDIFALKKLEEGQLGLTLARPTLPPLCMHMWGWGWHWNGVQKWSWDEGRGEGSAEVGVRVRGQGKVKELG